MTRRSFALIALQLSPAAASATVCSRFLARIFGLPPEPALVRGLQLFALNRLRWSHGPAGYAADFRSEWGPGSLLVSHDSLTVWLRPTTAHARVSPAVVAALNLHAGPLLHREVRGERRDFISLRLKRVGTEDFDNRARRFLNLLFSELPARLDRGDDLGHH